MRRYCAPHKFNCNMKDRTGFVKVYFAVHKNFMVFVLSDDVTLGYGVLSLFQIR